MRSGRSCERSSACGDDETLLVQSGKPVGVFRTHEGAPRVLIANSLLVPRWATWDEFRRLEAEGLTMFGQMTAGSWIYIGTQGILQGTYQTFAAAGEVHFGSADLQRPDDPDRRTGRDGRGAAARGDDGRRRDSLHRGRSVAGSHAGSRRGTSTRLRTRSRTASRAFAQRLRRGGRCRSPSRETPPKSCRNWHKSVNLSTSSPTRQRPTIRSRATSRSGSRSRRPLRYAVPTRTSTSGGRERRSRSTSKGCSSTSARAAMSSTMATIFAGRPMRRA